jgi:hypothetical protein
MRNLLLLLNDLIKLIPIEEHQDFKENLEKVRDRVSFTAPEDHYSMWQEAQYEISKYFERMDKLPKWGTPFVNLWTNRQDT